MGTIIVGVFVIAIVVAVIGWILQTFVIPFIKLTGYLVMLAGCLIALPVLGFCWVCAKVWQTHLQVRKWRIKRQLQRLYTEQYEDILDRRRAQTGETTQITPQMVSDLNDVLQNPVGQPMATASARMKRRV